MKTFYVENPELDSSLELVLVEWVEGIYMTKSKPTQECTSLMTCNLDKNPFVLQIFIDGGTSF